MSTLDHNDHHHAYTAYYCEENVYHLVEWLTASGQHGRVFAVFVSNEVRQNLLFYQRAAAPGAQYVVWDYHVFAMTVADHESDSANCNETRVNKNDDASRGKKSPEAYVWDLDTQLGLKVPFHEYINETFRPGLYRPGGIIDTLMELQEPRFRVVRADDLLANFASDRSHMLIEGTQEYNYPPPTSPCIQSTVAVRHGTMNNLWSRFLEMSVAREKESDAGNKDCTNQDRPFGQVFNLADFNAAVFLEHVATS